MEGLTAIALAGNIIQFISFSSALVSKSREIHKSTSGLPDESIDLCIVARDIKGLSNRVLSTRGSTGPFVLVAKECDKVACALLAAISEIRLKHGRTGLDDRPTMWHSFRRALKCVWKKQQIEDLKARLQLLRDQMMMHMVSNTSHDQVRLMGLLGKWEKGHVKMSDDITQQIRGLESQLEIVQRNLVDIQNDDRWTKLYGHLSEVTAKVQQVSRTNTIITSLRYEYMELRYEAINNAYQKTFDWIYRPRNLEPSDPRSQIKFIEWLENGNGVYWITGKPGSGKSTLMKYLYDHKDSTRHLLVWANHTPLVRAHFYFWNPGQQMQKTLEGLLQTLLFYILQACPELVPALCPGRWSMEPWSHDTASSTAWSLTELRRAFDMLTTQTPLTTKFYFHIDGLDEYYGDCCEVIDVLKNLSSCPNIKLCLSSRPWNEFQDAFGSLSPHILQLHNLTKEDIKMFAQEKLQSYILHADFEPQLFEDLVRHIVEKAQGVFLWVCLAVRSLRDGITNGDTMTILDERLQAIPSDLEKFFELILASVDKIYQTRMAKTFLAALRTDRPLKIIHYYFLEHDDLHCDYNLPAMQWPQSKVQRMVQQTQRRLNGRFKGLLEPASTIDIQCYTPVDFLHRTLRDFLLKGRMRHVLELWAVEEIHVLTSVSRAFIADSKFVAQHPSCALLKRAIDMAFQATKEKGKTAHYFAILDQVELEYERLHARYIGCRSIGLVLRAAVSIGHTEYVGYRLTNNACTTDLDHLLKHAFTCPLDPSESFSSCLQADSDSNSLGTAHCKCFYGDGSAVQFGHYPAVAMIVLLLDKGANPNVPIDGASVLDVFLNRMIDTMDLIEEEQALRMFELFLDRRLVNLKTTANLWHRLLVRKENAVELALPNTLRCFKRLFKEGLDPNTDVGPDITMTTVLLRNLPDIPHEATSTSRSNQNELLREFFQYGADITQVYKDRSEHGWLNNVCNELSFWPTLVYNSSRTSQLEVFFEYGLDPNIELLNSNRIDTVWTHLLYALNSSLRQAPFERTHHQVIFECIILCLRYGADPYAEKLQDILEWMNDSNCRLSSLDAREMLLAVQQELTHADSQAHIHMTNQQHIELRRTANIFRDYNNTNNICTMMHSYKRSTEPSDTPVHATACKRHRFS